MARTHGRAPRGERLRAAVPHGHWNTTTFVAGLTIRGMISPFVLSGPINRAAFETYVEKVLVPAKRVVKFKVGRLMRERVCGEEVSDEPERVEAPAPEPPRGGNTPPPPPPPSPPPSNSPF